ncbi:hypothetical protein KGF54_002287 [Candida jiufengensis]|uniref:uncharacterized protein n=1 Tax=Candida jiufengensis TaxID=497108 RepID=UPI002225022C|nr:uncharacterized protein KGF54_002287 [Candida jiufengensis]KAI5954512.1 hypothetical protein KGF54_002287 [Candida jiufengensis]
MDFKKRSMPKSNFKLTAPSLVDPSKVSRTRLAGLNDYRRPKISNFRQTQSRTRTTKVDKTKSNIDEKINEIDKIKSLHQLTPEFIKQNYVYVLINYKSEFFKEFKFKTKEDIYIGPYKLLHKLDEETFEVEVGLSTNYDTKFSKNLLKFYSVNLVQPHPRNLQHFIATNSIESIIGINETQIILKYCNKEFGVVFNLKFVEKEMGSREFKKLYKKCIGIK